MSLVDVIGQAFIKSGNKSALKYEAKVAKKEAAEKAWVANVEAVQDWEHALTYVIEAAAEGTEAPEWAVAYVNHDLLTATAILRETQKNAILSHVNADKKSDSYNAELANLGVQDVTVKTQGAVNKRIEELGRIFKARTSDVRYRKTLISTVVSYSLHKAKAIPTH